jgi:membrane protease subunit HflC
MKSLTTLLILGFMALVGLTLYLSAFVVDEGKQAIVTQFGAPIRTVEKAGLSFKIPLIQEVSFLERRLLPWDGDPESMQTKDKKRIDIDVWARWRIVDPMKFFIKVKTEQRGQKFLDDLVDSAVRDVVAQHNLIDVVRKSNAELIYGTAELERTVAEVVQGNGRDDVEQRILESVDLSEYGMKVESIRIKRVNYVASVRAAVYKRMISERIRIARLYESEAIEEENKILGATQKELDEIEGEREQRTVEIRGKADAEVIRLTAEAYGKSPGFYELLRRLEVVKNTIKSDSRLILTTDSDLFQMLKRPIDTVSPSTFPASD